MYSAPVPSRAHTFKNGFDKYAKPKTCIWLSSKAVRVPVKPWNHEPQASTTWQARLESAYNKMLVKEARWRKRCYEIDHAFSSWEKLESITTYESSLAHGLSFTFYWHKLCHIFSSSAWKDDTDWGTLNIPPGLATEHFCSAMVQKNITFSWFVGLFFYMVKK